MLNGLNQLNLQEYNHECNEKFFTRKITVISNRKFYYNTLTRVEDQNNLKVLTRISNTFNRNY